MSAVRKLAPVDHAEWLRMRRALWPRTPRDDLEAELDEKSTGNFAVFVAPREAGGLCAFIELSIRPESSGCDTKPLGYIEGWYVEPDARRRGIGRALVAAAEVWAVSRGCVEMGSDTEIENVDSQRAHAALGYTVAETVVVFHRKIGGRGAS